MPGLGEKEQDPCGGSQETNEDEGSNKDEMVPGDEVEGGGEEFNEDGATLPYQTVADYDRTNCAAHRHPAGVAIGRC